MKLKWGYPFQVLEIDELTTITLNGCQMLLYYIFYLHDICLYDPR